jgi:pyruvate/2-oxoacid:ferredoxin oxidoreductase beta subunit
MNTIYAALSEATGEKLPHVLSDWWDWWYDYNEVYDSSRTLKNAITHKGFSFVEVLSPGPTQYGRRNAFRSAFEMIQGLKNTCVSVEKAKGMSAEELAGKVVVGEFVK